MSQDIRQSDIPACRIRVVNQLPVRADGEYVLYWMTAFRRPHDNFSLDRAIEWSRFLGKPLVVLEALRVGYRWACDRFHRWVIDGMAAHRRAFSATPVIYFPYLEPEANAGRGLMETLAQRAAVMVTDDYPCFFLPALLPVIRRRVNVRCEAIDSNGLLPIHATEKLFERAFSFRTYAHRNLLAHLERVPDPRPTYEGVPRNHVDLSGIRQRWPTAEESLIDPGPFIQGLSIDHTIGAIPNGNGGWRAAELRLSGFLDRLDQYADQRNDPDCDAGSQLSPYLHFGNISSHRIWAEVIRHQNWTPEKINSKQLGKNAGWFGMNPSAEGFLDQLVTWRELGFNRCALDPQYDRFERLPLWAINTLEQHATDPRDYVYSLDEFATAQTHDALWNAAQTQLVREGRIHNYLRMLWGKKILEWTQHPRDALEIMIDLNNRFALDGRDPNSYTGIMWTLGRFDRPWGPERPIFGTIRYMSSDNTRRKVSIKRYLEAYGSQQTGSLFDGSR